MTQRLLIRVAAWSVVAGALVWSDNSAQAQRIAPPAVRVRPAPQDNRPRRVNDDIEGTVFEFEIEATDDDKALGGQFRVEGDGVFDTRVRVELGDVGNLRARVREGRDGEAVELSGALPPSRIGDLRRIDGGKWRIDFKPIDGDEETLDGMMILWRKEEQRSVWIGYYRPHIDPENPNRLGEKRDVELRTVQD